MSNITNTRFEIIQKSITIKDNNEQGLYIEGIANSGLKDLSNDIITKEAMEQIVKQATNHNLHMQHSTEFQDIIGTIEKAELTDEGILIRSRILDEYKDVIHSRLTQGIKLGLSVSGLCKRDEDNYHKITEWELLEISLTPIPCDQNTMGTVQIAKSFKEIINPMDKKMEDNNMTNKELTEEQVIDLINEAFNAKQEEFLETIRNELKDEFQASIDEIIKRIETLESQIGDGTSSGNEGNEDNDAEQDEDNDGEDKSQGEDGDTSSEGKEGDNIQAMINKAIDDKLNTYLKDAGNDTSFKYKDEKEKNDEGEDEGKEVKTFTPSQLAKMI